MRIDDEIYVKNLKPGVLIPHYLMCCYLYYIEDNPAISDYAFDLLSKRLLEVWDTVDHFHKSLLTKEMVSAATGYAIDYPLRVQLAAKQWKASFDFVRIS